MLLWPVSDRATRSTEGLQMCKETFGRDDGGVGRPAPSAVGVPPSGGNAAKSRDLRRLKAVLQLSAVPIGQTLPIVPLLARDYLESPAEISRVGLASRPRFSENDSIADYADRIAPLEFTLFSVPPAR
jgi:hypothetical protein